MSPAIHEGKMKIVGCVAESKNFIHVFYEGEFMDMDIELNKKYESD
jgi:hypothetical protein